MSWVGPTSATATSESKDNNKVDHHAVPLLYRALVVDSGPIIKHSSASLVGKALHYYTIPAVMDEIRDGKARAHLQQWQNNFDMDLMVRDCSAQSLQRVTHFAKQTGDYASLSAVDLQVCALVLDLEQEGTMTLDHVRTTPKRMIGLGTIQSLNTDKKKNSEGGGVGESKKEQKQQHQHQHSLEDEVEYDVEEEDDDSQEDDDEPEANTIPSAMNPPTAAPKSWAMLVHPSAAPPSAAAVDNTPTVAFGSLTISSSSPPEGAGQFDDAGDDDDDDDNLEEDLESDFPSFAAAATVPYEGSDNENDNDDLDEVAKRELLQERNKQQSLLPLSKSGKHYNSFRKYGNLMKPAAPKTTTKAAAVLPSLVNLAKDDNTNDDGNRPGQSRLLGGGMGSAEAMKVEDDDGEGWITSKSDISQMKAANGCLDPLKTAKLGDPTTKKKDVGPPLVHRTACTTTDFAMQNVLLQMGLCLVSVDGMQIRRLKSWVTRCGACFKIHTDSELKPGIKRLFCSHCGSDMMQRIAASVDGNTGRLKLHLSKRYRHNLRGTKYSLPKAGSGNRFQGDLLLREDQLMMGAWNQKVKVKAGSQSKAHAQSIFGKDIASNVGCNAPDASSDLKVGFGRRNPNASKGRERRGKKKKSDDRACGLRRY